MMSAKIVFSLSVSPFPSMHCKTQCMLQWWSFFLESVMKTPLFFQALFLLHCYTHFTVKVVVELSKVGLREIKVRRNSYVCDYSCGLYSPPACMLRAIEVSLSCYCIVIWHIQRIFSGCLNNMWSSSVIESASSILSRCVFFQWIMRRTTKFLPVKHLITSWVGNWEMSGRQ